MGSTGCGVGRRWRGWRAAASVTLPGDEGSTPVLVSGSCSPTRSPSVTATAVSVAGDEAESSAAGVVTVCGSDPGSGSRCCTRAGGSAVACWAGDCSGSSWMGAIRSGRDSTCMTSASARIDGSPVADGLLAGAGAGVSAAVAGACSTTGSGVTGSGVTGSDASAICAAAVSPVGSGAGSGGGVAAIFSLRTCTASWRACLLTVPARTHSQPSPLDGRQTHWPSSAAALPGAREAASDRLIRKIEWLE